MASGSTVVAQWRELSETARFRLGLGALTAGGALWRLWFLFTQQWGRPLSPNDSLYYSAQGRQLATGVWFRDFLGQQPAAEHGPLLPLVLAPFSWMEDHLRWQRLATVLIGIAVVWMIGILGRAAAGTAVGLIAAGVAAVYPNIWMSDGLVMSESLALLLVTAVLAAQLAFLEHPSRQRAALTGALIGLAALTRSELALLLPRGIVVVWRWKRPQLLEYAAMSAALAALVIAPWVLFNLTRFEQPVLLTTNDGTTLLGAYCDDTFDGVYRAGWYVGCVLDHPSASIEEPSLRSAAQRRAAMSYARENAEQLPVIAALRLGRMLDLYGVADMERNDIAEERPRWGIRLGVAMFWSLMVLGVVGVTAVRPPARWVLVMPVVSTVLITVLFYGAHRLRVALEPTLVVAAATGFMVLLRLGRQRWLPPQRH